MADVLVIDDDKSLCRMLADMVHRMGHIPSCCHTLQEGLELASRNDFDAVFLDVNLPDGDGLRALPSLRETSSKPEVIIVTGAGDPDGAELAIKNGAWDYIQKPLSPKAVVLPLNRVLKYRENLKKAHRPTVGALNFHGIVGDSPALKTCLDSVAHAAAGSANVLIVGETGTGKELLAQAIHENGPRAGKNFVVVDCAALPETLVENSLFGHERGAYTGADRSQDGLIRQADGGTLFLDEIGELSLSIQKAFLRVLQERRFRPVGGKREIASNFRMIAATNRDLDAMAQRNEFRSDLLFRLRSMYIEAPPLRERSNDIEALTLHYVEKICNNYEAAAKGVAPEFFEVLKSYHWPGNVRELINTLEGAIIESGSESLLLPIHLPQRIRIKVARDSIRSLPRPSPKSVERREPAASSQPSAFQDYRESILAKAEQKYLEDLMRFTRGSIKRRLSYLRTGPDAFVCAYEKIWRLPSGLDFQRVILTTVPSHRTNVHFL